MICDAPIVIWEVGVFTENTDVFIKNADVFTENTGVFTGYL